MKDFTACGIGSSNRAVFWCCRGGGWLGPIIFLKSNMYQICLIFCMHVDTTFLDSNVCSLIGPRFLVTKNVRPNNFFIDLLISNSHGPFMYTSSMLLVNDSIEKV